MRKKALTKKDRKIKNYQTILENDIQAKMEIPKKYKFTLHDLKTIRPLNEPQTRMFESFMNGNHIVADGSAGTGKTFAAIYLALNELLNKKSNYDKIIIVRSAVATRDIGYLPGTEEEKMVVYERPYIEMFTEMLQNGKAYERLKSLGMVDFMPTSFIRGLNWDNSIVVVDEVQNLNFHEINSVLTRLGMNSKIILCGDYIQSDLNKNKHDKTGIGRFVRVVKSMDDFDYIQFLSDDIIRSEFVKRWIKALEEDSQNN